MRRIVGGVFALVLALSLVLMPLPALAQDGDEECVDPCACPPAGDLDACPQACADALVNEISSTCGSEGTCLGGCSCDCPTACCPADCEHTGDFKVCEWSPVKWWDNENSWRLYLSHWGRTPVTAMSRLAGLCGPPNICKNANPQPDCSFGSDRYVADDANTCTMGGCAHCRVGQEGFLAGCDCPDPEVCEETPCDACACLAVGGEKCPEVPVSEQYCPKCAMCWGTSLAYAGKSWAGCDISEHPRVNNDHPNHFGNSEGGAANRGGDWGITGCPHTECIAQTWCLQDNLCPTCTP